MKSLGVIILSMLMLISCVFRANAGDGLAKHRLYIISVGVSEKERKIIETEKLLYTNFACPTCLTDAEGLPDYFLKLGKRVLGQYDSVIIWKYINSDITLDSLYQAFKKVENVAQSTDDFVFYYAANSWGSVYKTEISATEGFYSINRKLNPNDPLGSYSFTLANLKVMTDRIASQKQLIIFDTGNGDVIQADFYRNFFSDNPIEANFTRKDRIIICPEVYSSETMDTDGILKGDMYRIISHMPDSFNVFTLFSKPGSLSDHRKSYKKFMQLWYQQQLTSLVQIKVLKESEYFKILSAIKPNISSGKRGMGGTGEAKAPDSSLVARKKKALIIATNTYDASVAWEPLRNPVNDGKAVANVLQQLYNYEVKTIFDAPRDSIMAAISALCDSAGNPYDQYIIYFAGHGFFDKKQKAGYIVCKDSKAFKDPAKPTMGEEDTYLDYTVLFKNIDASLNKVVFITDVCFGGTAMNSLLQGKTAAANPDNEATTMLNPYKRVLSSGITEVDDFIRLQGGGISQNSPFATTLLQVLNQKKGDLDFDDIMSAINKAKLSPKPIDFYFGTITRPNEFTF